MSENNQMMSVEGQLVGMPLAGPESFSQQQLEYLKRALGVDETVLWEASSPLDTSCLINSISRNTAVLSEAISNFERVRIYAVWNPWSGNFSGCNMFEYPGTNTKGGYVMYDCNHQGYIAGGAWSVSGTTFTLVHHWQAQYPSAMETGDSLGGIFKVVGIHRIAGGNQ